MKKAIINFAALCMAMIISACGDSGINKDNEAAMNTIQPYYLTDEDSEMVSLVAPGSEDAITQFAVDETYKSVIVGFDYYEKGKLVKKNNAESEMLFSYDAGPQETYGKIYTFIDDDDVEINLYGKSGKLTEADGLGSKTPLSNDDLTLDDVNSGSNCMLDGPVNIEKNKKIFIYATIGDNDDELEVGDLSALMEDEELLSSYDKCFVFYAKFK